jgi:hypothetical protein
MTIWIGDFSEAEAAALRLPGRRRRSLVVPP